MNGSSRHRIVRILAAAFAAALCLALLLPCAAGAEERRVLRVGFPIQPGFTERTEDGSYTGYTYDYLEEIAQYTGWDYEFVVMEGDLNETLGQMLEMLRDGELDLLGAMNYSDSLAQIYDYPGASYGTAHTVLAVPSSNVRITPSNFQRLNGLRIAVPGGASVRLAELERFCRSNNMSPNIIPCEEADIETFVQQGGADVMVCMDVGLPEDFRVVAKFAPTAYYFATTKGNADIVSKLNTAILKIDEANPYFSTTLYEKYFGVKRGDQGVTLSAEERAFVKQQEVLRVAVAGDKIPLQFQDESGQFRGIARDVFDYIAEQTGLGFTFVTAGDQEELARMLEAGEVDLLAGIPYDHDTARGYNVALTQPYLTAQLVMVVNRQVDVSDLAGKRLVLPQGVPYQGEPVSELTYLDTVEACIAALDRGDADFTYGNGYTMQYYAAKRRYRNVVAVPQSGQSQQSAIGVSKPVDVTLMTILNKAIASLPESELQTIIYRNIGYTGSMTLLEILRSDPLILAGAVAVPAAAVIVGVLLYARARSRFGRRLAEENERYRQLCELSNEYLFEYDYATDRMLLTEQCARHFGADPVQERFRQRLFMEDGPEQAARRALFQHILEGRGGGGELECALPGGDRRWFRITAKLLLDRTGQPLRAVGKLTDIQNEKAQRDELEQRAQRDSLTGLYNAAACRRLVEQKLAGDPDSGALMILDIDLFKQVNDTYGHFTGDNVLKAVTALLEEHFRREDVVGRPGGDEFLIYLSGVRDSRVVAEKCRRLLAGSARLGEAKGSCEVTLSIGAAMADREADYDALYRRADRALYQAKANGRDGFVLFEAGEGDKQV